MSEPDFSYPTSTLEYVQSLPRPERPPRPRLWLHLLLLAATCFTTLVVGARMEFDFLHNLPPLTALVVCEIDDPFSGKFTETADVFGERARVYRFDWSSQKVPAPEDFQKVTDV